MNIIKLLLIFILCLPSFAGIKANRSSTNPATYIDSSGVIQLLILSNKVRPANYYNTTGFHQLAGWLNEESSTNYVLNSYCSIDANSNNIADNFNITENVVGAITYTLNDETSFINISNSKSQNISFTGESGRYFLFSTSSFPVTHNDVISGSIFVKGSFGSGSYFLQFGTFDQNGITSGDYSSSNISISATDQRRFSFSTTLVNRSRNIYAFSDAGSGKVRATFYSSGIIGTGSYITITGTTNYNGSYTVTSGTATYCEFVAKWVSNDATGILTQPISTADFRIRSNDTVGGTHNFRVTGFQVEKKSSPTSFITTTTSAVTRNAESYKCRKFAD